MNVSVFGAGYVGLVSGVCLASLGHHVCIMDVDADKIAQLNQGVPPIFEDQLEPLLKEMLTAERLQCTTDMPTAVTHGEIQMIAVGTPSAPDGSADLQFVEAVARALGEQLSEYRLIVNKSTVPVGTADTVKKIIVEQLKMRDKDIEFDVASNPEFLREGQAIHDFLQPDRILVGVDNDRAKKRLEKLYQPLIDQGYRFEAMQTRSAELTKYAANALLATKIAFTNEISLLAEKVGADIREVMFGVGLDQRISPQFLNAGCGFGGSCFPKDVAALKHMQQSQGLTPSVLQGVLDNNDVMQAILFNKLMAYYQGDLTNKAIALWGLAFKPNTDDVRCATSRVLMEKLFAAGARVKAFDPLAMRAIQSLYADEKQLTLCDSKEEALEASEALLLVTEWPEFANPDFSALKQRMTTPVIFDGRNLLSAEAARAVGVEWFGIGI